MGISEASVREVAMMAEADHRHAQEEERTRGKRVEFAERIAANALYAHACGIPLAAAIRGAVLVQIGDDGIEF
jgi:hypothetical protein